MVAPLRSGTVSPVRRHWVRVRQPKASSRAQQVEQQREPGHGLRRPVGAAAIGAARALARSCVDGRQGCAVVAVFTAPSFNAFLDRDPGDDERGDRIGPRPAPDGAEDQADEQHRIVRRGGNVAGATLGTWEAWPWSLTELIPDAARAANAGNPAMLPGSSHWASAPDDGAFRPANHTAFLGGNEQRRAGIPGQPPFGVPVREVEVGPVDHHVAVRGVHVKGPVSTGGQLNLGLSLPRALVKS